jgi:hypothetical protein
MYCGHYFHPQAMDMHIAECYRVFKANQEIAKKNMEHQVKSNKSQYEAGSISLKKLSSQREKRLSRKGLPKT